MRRRSSVHQFHGHANGCRRPTLVPHTGGMKRHLDVIANIVPISEAERRADMVTAYAEGRQATGLWAGIGHRRVASRSTGSRDSLASKGAGRLRSCRRAAQARKVVSNFEKAARDCYEALKEGWKNRRHTNWISSLENLSGDRHEASRLGGQRRRGRSAVAHLA